MSKSDDIIDVRPKPGVLTICTPGVNHVLQFANFEGALAAYRRIADARDHFNKVAADSPQARGQHEESDDYGSQVCVDLQSIVSVRVVDVMAEHRAAGRLKLAEFYAALEFEEVANTDHPALKLLRARQQGPGIIRQ